MDTRDPDTRAREFDEIADNIFFPIYPVLAAQILSLTGIRHGHCLDVGCGGGHLGLSLARLTGMELTLVDCCAPALTIAEQRARDWRVAERTHCLTGDVHALPLPDASVDLCISRGSLWFWDDSARAFADIVRVLKPGGQAFIGAGFATPELKLIIDERMKARDPSWPERRKRFSEGHTPERYAALLGAMTELDHWQVIDDARGFWLHFRRVDDAVITAPVAGVAA